MAVVPIDCAQAHEINAQRSEERGSFTRARDKHMPVSECMFRSRFGPSLICTLLSIQSGERLTSR